MADLPITSEDGAQPCVIVDVTTPANTLKVNADGSINASLGSTGGKANVLKTGTLTTVAVTADQVVLTYTVTAGKTFYLEYVNFGHHLTALPGNNNPVAIGTISVETPSGTKIYTKDCFHPSYDVPGPDLGEPAPIAAGVVIRVVCTPAAATSTVWRANFGGYER